MICCASESGFKPTSLFTFSFLVSGGGLTYVNLGLDVDWLNTFGLSGVSYFNFSCYNWSYCYYNNICYLYISSYYA